MARFERALERFGRLDSRLDRLRHFCAVFLDTFEEGDRLCPFCMIATAQEELPAELRRRATAFWYRGERWLEAVFADGRERGELELQDEPRTVARLVVSALEGGMVTARAFDGRARFLVLADFLVASMLPEGTKPRSIADVEWLQAV